MTRRHAHRTVLIEDHGLPLIWIGEDDERGWVTVEDFKAFVWFIAFVGLFIAICAVSQ